MNYFLGAILMIGSLYFAIDFASSENARYERRSMVFSVILLVMSVLFLQGFDAAEFAMELVR